MQEHTGRCGRYNELIQELVSLYLAGLTTQEIKLAVGRFSAVIQSKRVEGHIKDIQGLIFTLEARNVLKPDNVTALETLSQTVGKDNALARIRDYGRWVEATNTPIGKVQSRPVNNSSKSSMPPSLTDKVFRLVAQQLGPEWRQFARNSFIRLSESEIQQIDTSSRDLVQSAQEVLEHFKEKNPTADHVQTIKNALVEIKRNGIVRNIDDLLSNEKKKIK